MNRYINMIALTAIFVTGISVAEAGNRSNGNYHRNDCARVGAAHHGRGSFADNRDGKFGVYGRSVICAEWETSRQEYNVSRDVPTIRPFQPEHYFVNADTGLRPDERNSR